MILNEGMIAIFFVIAHSALKSCPLKWKKREKNIFVFLFVT